MVLNKFIVVSSYIGIDTAIYNCVQLTGNKIDQATVGLTDDVDLTVGLVSSVSHEMHVIYEVLSVLGEMYED